MKTISTMLSYYLASYTSLSRSQQGCANRTQFWGFFLFNIILTPIWFMLVVVMELAIAQGKEIFGTLATSCYIFIATLNATVRRLHDVNKSGKLLWLTIVPVVGPLVILYFLCKPTVAEDNEYALNVES